MDNYHLTYVIKYSIHLNDGVGETETTSCIFKIIFGNSTQNLKLEFNSDKYIKNKHFCLY